MAASPFSVMKVMRCSTRPVARPAIGPSARAASAAPPTAASSLRQAVGHPPQRFGETSSHTASLYARLGTVRELGIVAAARWTAHVKLAVNADRYASRAVTTALNWVSSLLNHTAPAALGRAARNSTMRALRFASNAAPMGSLVIDRAAGAVGGASGVIRAVPASSSTRRTVASSRALRPPA